MALSSCSGNMLLKPHTYVRVPANSFSLTQLSLISGVEVKRRRLRLNRSLKCSFDYRDNDSHVVAECAKPDEILWRKELCNSVNLIGNVGVPVEIKHLPSGKVLAWTRLGVKKSATETTWVNLTFWDELAHIAFQHVEKGRQIYVAGRLISDVVESEDGRQQTYYKVVVQQLNFVERNSTSAPFSNRDSDSMTTSRKFSNNSPSGLSSAELWQAFFANPLDWWDNRTNKRNPKYPDFKHKDTGEALWVESRFNPPWVKSQLVILDERMGSFRDQNDRMHLTSMTDNDFMMPFQ